MTAINDRTDPILRRMQQGSNEKRGEPAPLARHPNIGRARFGLRASWPNIADTVRTLAFEEGSAGQRHP